MNSNENTAWLAIASMRYYATNAISYELRLHYLC
jgi:hypothetical protein